MQRETYGTIAAHIFFYGIPLLILAQIFDWPNIKFLCLISFLIGAVCIYYSSTTREKWIERQKSDALIQQAREASEKVLSREQFQKHTLEYIHHAGLDFIAEPLITNLLHFYDNREFVVPENNADFALREYVKTVEKRYQEFAIEVVEYIAFLGNNLPKPEGLCYYTPLNQLLKRDGWTGVINFPVPLPLMPLLARFEHTYICAGSGAGKTTLLSSFINQDFQSVARGEASIIVMESNRDFVKSIERLKRFAPGGDLAGRLVVCDCEDVDFPLALNLFDVGIDDVEGASSADREALMNSAISMLDYIFRALLGAELTSRQSVLFNFTIQLLMQIKGATLDTFIDLMQPGASQNFKKEIAQLDPDARRFFELKFDSKELVLNKGQVVDRLFAIKRIRTLSRMFAAPKTKFNLYEEMGKGRVILINTAKRLLQDDGVEIVGRFMIAMILLAAEKRAMLPQEERLPCFVYLDEAHDYIAKDEKLPNILAQARKYRVAMILAHQDLSQIKNPAVFASLMSNTSIKLAARLSDADAGTLARNMGTTPAFLTTPPYTFAAYVRGKTPTAVHVPIPNIDFRKMPQMTQAEADHVRAVMRERYSVDAPKLRTVAEDPAPYEPDPNKHSKW